MIATEDQVAEWKHAYYVLDVPESASQEIIKSAFRKLVRRWHPDRYHDGTGDHAEATRVTELLNAAYAAIREAPLANHLEVEHAYSPGRPPYRPPSTPPKPHKFDWFGFWVRFVCGAIFGVFIGLGAVLRAVWISESAHSLAIVLGIVTAASVLCGLASGFGGDGFWYSFRDRWW